MEDKIFREIQEQIRKKYEVPKQRFSLLYLIPILLIVWLAAKQCQAQPPGWQCKASWYGEAYRGKPTAWHRKGVIFNPDELTCASWDYNFGEVLVVTNADNLKQVFVEVTDRGPKMELWELGIRLDLSRAAFMQIRGESREGRLNVFVELVPEVEVSCE